MKDEVVIYVKSAVDPSVKLSPERKVYAAVVTRAVVDASYWKGAPRQYKRNGTMKRNDPLDAVEWILDDVYHEGSLLYYLEHLTESPESVRNKIIKFIQSLDGRRITNFVAKRFIENYFSEST